MRKYLITYLVTDFDATGSSRLRTQLYTLESEGPLLLVARIVATGFFNERGEFVMPAAVLMVREVTKTGGLASGKVP